MARLWTPHPPCTVLYCARTSSPQPSVHFIITLGDKGAIYSDDDNYHRVKGNKVHSIDFTGAGDMFLGAFMHYFVTYADIKKSLIFANNCASEIIKVYGAKFEEDSDYKSLISR